MKIETSKMDNVDVFYEEDFIIPADVYCSVFGCGKKLSLTEQLCGTKCIDHTMKAREIF